MPPVVRRHVAWAPRLHLRRPACPPPACALQIIVREGETSRRRPTLCGEGVIRRVVGTNSSVARAPTREAGDEQHATAKARRTGIYENCDHHVVHGTKPRVGCRRTACDAGVSVDEKAAVFVLVLFDRWLGQRFDRWRRSGRRHAPGVAVALALGAIAADAICVADVRWVTISRAVAACCLGLGLRLRLRLGLRRHARYNELGGSKSA